MICKNSHDMQNLIRVADAITATILRALDWFYLTLMLFFLGLAVWLALGPHGHLKLGNPNATPECSTLAWRARLVAAGMGAGRKPASIALAALGSKAGSTPS
jgi:choline-glycine betaine transporter